MKKNYTLKFILLALLLNIQINAQTDLTSGEIVFTAYNADGNPDTFSFLFLQNVDSGTEFLITDDSDWNGTSFGHIEGTYKFTATTAISAGEEVHVVHNGSTVTMTTTSTNILGTIAEIDSGFTTSFAGDNLFIYQDQMGTEVLIAGLNMELGNLGTSGNAWETSNSGTSDTALPAGKTNGQGGFVGLFPNGENSEQDNARYKGSMSISYTGSNVDILNAIMDWNNWEYSNSTAWPANTNVFSITSILNTEETTLENVTIYPNPVQNEITIQGAIVQKASLFSVTGALIKTVHSSKINTSDVTPGIYFLTIKTSEGTVTKKIVKQ